MESHAPKVFICHASEDKERFVIKFAERLRGDGIDAWVDKWEMKLGDSLVRKIFDEGLKNSDIVIVVISKFSIHKNWVKEELDSAVYKKIEGKCRVIPVIIDTCIVPESLKHTLHIRIQNLESYDEQYNEIRASIFGESSKPPLGKLPTYKTSGQLYLSKLTDADSFVLQTICKMAFENDYLIDVKFDQILPQVIEAGITKEEFEDSFEILYNRGYVQGNRLHNNTFYNIKVPTYIREDYCNQCVENYSKYIYSVISAIVNEKNYQLTKFIIQERYQNP